MEDLHHAVNKSALTDSIMSILNISSIFGIYAMKNYGSSEGDSQGLPESSYSVYINHNNYFIILPVMKLV